MKLTRYSVPAALAAVFLTAQGLSAQTTILVNDNFTASSGANVGTVNNASSSGVGTYTTIQGTTGMTVTTASGFGSGNVLSFANNTNTYYRAFNGASSLTLSSLTVNQTLSLSFDMRIDGGTFAAAQNFSFGFVDNSPTNSILYANVDLNSGNSEFRSRAGSFNMSDAGTTVGTAWTEPTTVSATSFSLQLDITKVSNGYLLEYYRNDVLLGSSTQLSNGTWATALAGTDISGIAFRHSQTPGVVTYIDNVSASLITPVPEPASFALLGGLGALGFVATRRRRR